MPRFENHLADIMRLGGVEVAHFASDHLGDDLRNVHVRHCSGGDMFAVADDGNGVAHGGHLSEFV